MKSSREKISSQSSEVLHHFSHKRYFVNNLDSYHGTYILKELSKILERNQEPVSKQSMQSVGGEDAPLPPPPPEEPYEIVGTVTDPTLEKKGIPNVTRIIPKDACLPQMLTCGTVIIDIGCDRNELKMAIDYTKLLEELLKKQAVTSESVVDVEPAEGELKKRHLILISTVMTWAATKSLDPETPDMPFVESDFRKRKPHINYKMHYDVENEVVGIARKYKSQIGAIVVVPGVTYGAKEDVLYYWFQKAWENEKFLPIFGRGNNIIPLINVLDLAQIIYNLVNDFPKKLYMLAVEQNVTKLKEIVKPLGRAAGSGMFKCIPPGDAFLIPDIDQRIFDLMTLNLSMEPTFIVETMGLQWVSDLPFIENVPVLMKQFKNERSLKPFKVVVYGPPIVGKTTLANLICENYGLIYISAETVAQDTLEDLEWRVAHWEKGEFADLPMPKDLEEEAVTDAGDEDDQGDDEAVQEQAKITLALLQSGRMLSDEEITGFIRQRMMCREASNRGWVLDGLPATLPQTTILFEKGDEADSEVGEENHEEQFDEDVDLYSYVLKKLLPDIVVSLEATDNYICEKAMCQPEGDSRLDEEVVLKRLNEFRTNDARDVTPLNFFDELDIHPLVIQVTEHTDYAMKCPYGKVALRMGRPCRYSKLIELIEAAEKREKQERDTQLLKEAKATKELEEKMQQDREDKMEYWSELLSLVREEEEAALAAAGEPMRNYLVHHIFPTLTPALLEVAKLRPEDPIDFLAEYLFKLNPSGKMLEPGYNLQSEKLLGKIKLLDEALQDLDIQIDPLMPEEIDDSAIQAEIKKNINAMSAM